MQLVLIEKEGDKPVSEWIARKLKDFVYEQCGLEVRVEIKPFPVSEAELSSADVVNQRAGR